MRTFFSFFVHYFNYFADGSTHHLNMTGKDKGCYKENLIIIDVRIKRI